MFDLHGKVAVVTGGSRGLGQSIAYVLARYGADVAILDRADHGSEADIVHIIEVELGRRCVFCSADVSNQEDVSRAASSILEEFLHVDIIVNNAGVITVSPFLEISDDDLNKIIGVNLGGVMRCTKAFAEVMCEQKSGKVINIASTDGVVGSLTDSSELGVIGVVPYSASKGGVIAFTRALAAEWGAYGINVNAVCPTLIATSMTSQLLADPRKAETYSQMLPLGRTLVPSDLWGTIVFLASSASDMVTGQILAVDSGYLARGDIHYG